MGLATLSYCQKKDFETMCDELNEGVLVIDKTDGKILFSDKHLSDNLAIPMDQIIEKQYTDVFWPEFTSLVKEMLEVCEDGNSHTNVYFWPIQNSWKQISGRLTSWLDRRICLLITVKGMAENNEEKSEYRQKVYYDSLLKLPNGCKLEKDITGIETFQQTALIHFDINQFSNVNELYGWDVGDWLLKQIRDFLLSILCSNSNLYRVNDDEFCLLINSISMEDAKKKVEEILDRFTKPWKMKNETGFVNVYCTVAMGLVYGRSIKGEMRNLLYRTINSSEYNNPQGYFIYNEQVDVHIKKRLRMRQVLIECIQQGMQGFEVHYQPIINAKTRQWEGAEALCRWTMPDGTSVSPLQFIEEVERLGMIHKLDSWVRYTAMKQCKEWGVTEKQFFLDVNLSPMQAVDQDFFTKFLETIDELKYPKEKLNLEITETGKMNFSALGLENLHKLRDEGIKISLDDFGTGYSSFESLVNFPAEALKTEKAFIQNLEEDEYLQYLLKVMVDMAHVVGMKLIAEGVETQGQMEKLCAYNVDYMQGYLFSKPLSANEFEQQLGKYGSTTSPEYPLKSAARIAKPAVYSYCNV